MTQVNIYCFINANIQHLRIIALCFCFILLSCSYIGLHVRYKVLQIRYMH